MPVSYSVSITAPSLDVATALKRAIYVVGPQIKADLTDPSRTGVKWPFKTGTSINGWDISYSTGSNVSGSGSHTVKLLFTNNVSYSQYVIPANNKSDLQHRKDTDEGMFQRYLIDVVRHNRLLLQAEVTAQLRQMLSQQIVQQPADYAVASTINNRNGNVKITK